MKAMSLSFTQSIKLMLWRNKRAILLGLAFVTAVSLIMAFMPLAFTYSVLGMPLVAWITCIGLLVVMLIKLISD